MKASPIAEPTYEPELALLIASLRWAVQPGEIPAESLIAASPARLDWERVLHLANHHEVIPLLYTFLKGLDQQHPGLLPVEMLGRLKGLYLAIALRNQRLAESLLYCLDLLCGEGIPVLPFKGLALALQAYGDISLRQFLDLDVLIPEKEAGHSFQLLGSQGWQPEFELDLQTTHWLVRSAYHLRFERQRPGGETTLGAGSEGEQDRPNGDGIPKSGVRRKDVLEVHWTIADRSHIYPLQAELLWQETDTVRLLNREVSTFSVENALLAGCIHGAANQWQMLKWIADIARMVSAHPKLDWEYSLAQARRLGFQRVLLSGLSLAEQVAGVELPPPVQAGIHADARLASLMEQVREQILPAEVHPGPIANNRFYLRSRERMRDRLYYVVDQAFVPKPADWEQVRLPLTFYPLYYLLRPVRLAAKFFTLWLNKLFTARDKSTEPQM